MKRIVEESFAERFESKTVEAQLIEARLISIESMVRHNQNVLSRIDEKMPSSSIPKIRFDLLTADELRIASTSLLKLSEIRDVDDESRRSSDDIVSRLNSLLLKTIRFDNYSPSELAAHAEAEADASRFNKTLP